MPEDLAIIFAYHFAPENAIGALRPVRFYKYLTRLGFRCHVISAADVREVPGIDGQYVPDPFVERPREGLGWQFERVIRRFLLPGVVGTQWSAAAYRAALRYLANYPNHRVTVFSTFPPVGVHVAAYWLARQKGYPWIADYRDPLADNPVYDHISPFTKNVYRRLERIFVRAADFTIANTDAAQAKLKRSYPDRADRIQLIWNGFDPEDRLVPLPLEPGRKIIAHVGELYGGRSARPILESLRRLIDSGRLDSASFRVLLAGPVVEGSLPDSAFIEAAEREGWLTVRRDRVPQKEAHHMIQHAHELLLIQPQSALQVPGKLYEYLQLGRPIFCYLPPDSPVERILSRSGVPYRVSHASSTHDQLDNALAEFVGLPDGGNPPNEWFENEFNAQLHAAKVGELIQRLQRSEVKSGVLSQVPQDSPRI